jgi:hypothetical protein
MHKLAKFLGWFSLALGAAEVLAPRRMSRALGVFGRGGLVRGFGLREIASGVGILTSPAGSARRRAFLWSRVFGDALDLLTLGAAAKNSTRKGMVGAAAANVAAVSALDVIAASKR